MPVDRVRAWLADAAEQLPAEERSFLAWVLATHERMGRQHYRLDRTPAPGFASMTVADRDRLVAEAFERIAAERARLLSSWLAQAATENTLEEILPGEG